MDPTTEDAFDARHDVPADPFDTRHLAAFYAPQYAAQQAPDTDPARFRCTCYMFPGPHAHAQADDGWKLVGHAEDGTPIYLDLVARNGAILAETPQPAPTSLLTAVDDEGKSLCVPLEVHRTLVQRWRDAKQRASDAKAEADELRDEILHLLATDQTPALLAARNLESITATLDGAPAVRLRYVQTRRFDKRAAESENPELIARHTRLSDPEPRLEVIE